MSQTNPKKSRPTGKLAAHRERLRAESDERAAERAKRSTKEQLALIDSRPGESRRERERLTNG